MDFKKTCQKCGGTGLEPDREKIVKFLRRLRKSGGVTFRELGAEVGLSIGFLSDIENGRRVVGAAYLTRIHESLIKLID